MATVTLTRDAAWCVAEHLPGPVARALDDLARDWRKVFATGPTLLTPGDPLPEGPLVAIGDDAVLALTGVGDPPSGDAHEVQVRRSGDSDVICVRGGGPRGLLYAIYAFSREVLGVHPLWYWVGQEPEQADAIELDAGFEFRRGAPRFRMRGWFINDEDLLTAWAPSLAATHGIALNTWDIIYETILRCGGDHVVPGTFIFPDEPQLALAAARGLAVGQHHANPMGLNTFRWPDDVPYSWTRHPELLVAAWEQNLAAYGDAEVVWSVGLRGRHDRPFWYDGTDEVPSEAERGAIISEVIAKQVEMIRAVRPDDTIVMNLWMEGVLLMAEGHLSVPEDVVLVWSDDGHGVLRELGLAEGQGIYYHVAICDEIGSQISEMVEPELIAAELQRAVDAGATQLFLLNVSDIREYALTASVTMDLAWEEADVDRLTDRWAQSLLGEGPGGELAELWRRYFSAQWRFHPDMPDRFGDMGYHRMARYFLACASLGMLDAEFTRFRHLMHYQGAHTAVGDHTWRTFIEFVRDGTAGAQEGLDELVVDARSLRAKLEGWRGLFVQQHLVTQAEFFAEANRLVTATARAVLDDDARAAGHHLATARECCVANLRTLRASEDGKWADWFRGDALVRPASTIRLIDHYLGVLDGSRSHPAGHGLQPEELIADMDAQGAISAYHLGRSSAPQEA